MAHSVTQKGFGGRFAGKYSHIADQFHSLDQVQNALRQEGLESSNLIVGIDFTKSNEWTGKHTCNGRSLHAIGEQPTPYEQAISIIGRTLAAFDEDNFIPCFGFGDASTHDQSVFSFYQDHHSCQGFDEALTRYRQIVPNLTFSGPTSFAPIIEAAVKTVEESGSQYHVLVIIADGQVTQSVDTRPGHLSPQEKSTIDAIVAASEYPLSIVLVGVGDGPFDMMRQFDDNIPSRAFDNFQFVNFSEIMASRRDLSVPQKEAMFALAALMEIPLQYKATMELGLLGRQTGRAHRRAPLPPPQAVLQADLHAHGHGYMGPSAHSQGGTPQYPPAGNYSGAAAQSYPPAAYPPPTFPPSAPQGYPPSTPHGYPSYPPSTQGYPPSTPHGNPAYAPSTPQGYPPATHGNPSYPPSTPQGYPPATHGNPSYPPSTPQGYPPATHGNPSYPPSTPQEYPPSTHGNPSYPPSTPQGYPDRR